MMLQKKIAELWNFNIYSRYISFKENRWSRPVIYPIRATSLLEKKNACSMFVEV